MRISIAHPPVPLTPAVVDRSGGATARCGGATHGSDGKEEKLRNEVIQRVPEHLHATRDIPE